MGEIFLFLSVFSIACAGIPYIPEPKDQAWMDRHNGFVNNSLVNGDTINVLFYGDSITDAWNIIGTPTYNEHYVPLGVANYGIAADRTEHVLWRIINGEVENLAPKIVVLMIGTNNISPNTDSDIARGISAIIDQLRSRLPTTKVLLLGVLPRLSETSTNRIEGFNSVISILDTGNTVRYLNMRDTFYAGDGVFYEHLYHPDLVHLTAEGYAAWHETMTSLFTEMYQNSSE